MSPAVKFGLLAFLAAIAVAYFALVVWRAGTLSGVLLRRGYADKGWTEERLTKRVRLLGVVGLSLSVITLLGAFMRLIG